MHIDEARHRYPSPDTMAAARARSKVKCIDKSHSYKLMTYIKRVDKYAKMLGININMFSDVENPIFNYYHNTGYLPTALLQRFTVDDTERLYIRLDALFSYVMHQHLGVEDNTTNTLRGDYIHGMHMYMLMDMAPTPAGIINTDTGQTIDWRKFKLDENRSCAMAQFCRYIMVPAIRCFSIYCR